MAPQSRKAAEQAQKAVQKHRACDECRESPRAAHPRPPSLRRCTRGEPAIVGNSRPVTNRHSCAGSRKLACSKEPDGCSRCRREGIACHYSPQKPMGRPRKRRQSQESPPVAVVDDELLDTAETLRLDDGIEVPWAPQRGLPLDLPMEPDLHFLDHSMEPASFDLLDMMPGPYEEAPPCDPQLFAMHEGHMTDHAAYSFGLTSGDLMNDLHYHDEAESSSVPTAIDGSKGFGESLQSYMASQYSAAPSLQAPESTPSDISNTIDTPEPASSPDHSGSMKPIPNVPCGCLSSLYLALDSLSNLPRDIMVAIRSARHASKVCYDVIDCPMCSCPGHDDARVVPPMQAFQNMALLGALIPSACNAYARITEMIDEEAERARAEGRTLFFSFRDVGAGWGDVADRNDPRWRITACNNREMDPDAWRTTLRAILRLDVEGFTSPDGQRPLSMSLRNVVRLLDERSRHRHDKLDALADKGLLPKQSYVLMPASMGSVPLEERNCHRVVKAARAALDNLAIV